MFENMNNEKFSGYIYLLKKTNKYMYMLFMVLLVMLLISFSYHYQKKTYQDEKESALYELSNISDYNIDLFNSWLEVTKRDLRYLISLPSINGIIEGKYESMNSTSLEILNESLANSFIAYLLAKENVTQARLIGMNNHGLELVRVNKTNTDALPVRKEKLQKKSNRDYFKSISKLKENEIFISDINLNREYGRVTFPITPTLRIGIPVYARDSDLFGQLVLNFSMKNWLEQFKNISDYKYNLQSYLINNYGDYIVHPDDNYNFGSDLGSSVRLEDEFKFDSEGYAYKNGNVSRFSNDVFFYKKSEIKLDNNKKITLILMRPVKEIFIDSIKFGVYSFIGMLFIILLIASFITYLIKRFNVKKEMIESKMEKHLDLITSQIVNSSPVSIILTDIQGNIELVNDEAMNMFGYNKEEIVGQSIEILIPHTLRNSHISSRESYIQAPIKRKMGKGKSLKALKKNNEMVPVEIGLNTIDTFDGIKILTAIVDISQHLEMVEELSKRNSELDDFAYVASHDLKSPLTAIDQLASWLEEDLKDIIDQDSSENLRLMRSRINRLGSLLNDLLAFARAGKKTGNEVLIDSSILIQDMFDLNCIDASFQLKLNGHMPTFMGLKPPFEVVIRNLITNAIKHHDLRTGVITVSAKKKGDFIEFRFEDDGPGIDAIHRERVFGLFKTLRPRDEVEGSGMGLAVVKKIVENFGGTIEISERNCRGALFIFTWPDSSIGRPSKEVHFENSSPGRDSCDENRLKNQDADKEEE